jgi:hypothetical protein
MTDILVGLGQELEPVRQELDAASQASDGIDPDWLIGPVSSIKHELDEKLVQALDGITAARELIPAISQILGAPGAGPNRYLLLQQNCFELRPSGGLISSYGVLETTHNSISLPEYERSSKGVPRGIDMGAATPYPWGSPFFFWDAGWWPDFPTSAGVLSDFWAVNGKAPVEGFIAFDPIAIQYSLESLGPLQIPESGELVTAENLMEKILSHTQSEEDKEDFVKSLGHSFFSRIVSADPREWFDLGSAMHRALKEKHLLFYFNDPEIQAVFSAEGWSGEVHQTAGDYLLVAEGNLYGNYLAYEANMFISPELDVEVIRQEDGSLRHRVRYTLDNSAGSFEYSSYVRVYIPPEAVATDAEGLKGFGIESGKQVLGRAVFVPPGQRATAEFEYTTPAYDSILLEKQAGQESIPVLLRSDSREQEVTLVDRAELELR